MGENFGSVKGRNRINRIPGGATEMRTFRKSNNGAAIGLVLGVGLGRRKRLGMEEGSARIGAKGERAWRRRTG